MSQFRVKMAIGQIRRARAYTLHLIDELSPDDWFWHPEPFVTHVAWQIGHLAKAQYDHCLDWVRGRLEGDSAIVSDQFLELFKMGAVPHADRGIYPTVDDIRKTFDAVHNQALTELVDRSDEELQTPIDPSRPDRTKLAGLFWNSEHEFLHAGQIGMLRRLMGKPPLH